MWEQLRRIACPTLVVRGAESDVFAEETGRKMAATVPDCRFVTVPDAGHTVPQDNARGFLRAQRGFLDEARS
jgi:pimeloyl-ACP methyl ester carboxylesterase